MGLWALVGTFTSFLQERLVHWCPSPNMDCPYLLLPPNIWVFCAKARNERRRRTVSLSERRGRHVTHSFLSRAPHPHRSSGGSKNPHSLSIHPPSTPNIRLKIRFLLRIDDETRKTNGHLVSGGPTHPSRARPGALPSSIRDLQRHRFILTAQ